MGVWAINEARGERVSAQWTALAPGRGEMVSFASISSVLASDQTLLADIDLTPDRHHKSLDLAIGGKTFDAASARMALTLAHVGNIASSLKRVSDATEDYQEAVAEIKHNAAAAEQQLAEASMELSKPPWTARPRRPANLS